MKYWRGPDNSSLFKGPSPKEVAEYVRFSVDKAGPGAKVYLTGYSRGAATVIDAAAHLRKWEIIVEAMFLFDAVNRLSRLDAEFIPGNVRYCYHAIRDPETNSRRSFGSCGLWAEEGVERFELRSFFTTHGGVGGTPWGESGLIKPRPGDGMGYEFRPPPRLGPGRETAFGAGVTPRKTSRQEAEDLVRQNPTKWGDRIYEGFPDEAFTNVTINQEKIGMEAVRHWMWERLRKHGVVG
jgi:hypothetical protein